MIFTTIVTDITQKPQSALPISIIVYFYTRQKTNKQKCRTAQRRFRNIHLGRNANNTFKNFFFHLLIGFFVPCSIS